MGLMQVGDRWVDSVNSPEGVLRQANEHHTQCLNDWLATRSPADKVRLEAA